jgi:O-succinylbenzoic acid--CoA ligase
MGGLAPVYRSVMYGTTLVLREGFDAGGTADDIDAYDVTGVSLVPTMLKRMLDRRGTLSDSLRVVLLGGAPAPAELLERCRDYSIPVYPTYGMTEAASQITTATPRQTSDRIGTVGRPLFGTDVTVVGDDGDPVEPGDTGEVVVSGPTITPGYLARDGGDRSEADDGGDATGPDTVDLNGIDAADLDRSEFGRHGLHTGDVGRFDEEGYLHVLNRVDDRIITGGENVEPGEVGDVLREYAEVEDVAVVGLDDEVWGERVAALVAVGDRFSETAASVAGEAAIDPTETDVPDRESPESGAPTDEPMGDETSETGRESTESETETTATGPGDGTAAPSGADAKPAVGGESVGPAPIDEGAFVEFARERLAGFKIPKTVAYVEELPRTVSGTVDREATRALLRERGTDPRRSADSDLETAGFKPADPAEPAESDGPVGSGATPPSGEDGSEPDAADPETVDIADAEEVAGGATGDDERVTGPAETEADEEGGTETEEADSTDAEEGDSMDAEDAEETGDADAVEEDDRDAVDDG